MFVMGLFLPLAVLLRVLIPTSVGDAPTPSWNPPAPFDTDPAAVLCLLGGGPEDGPPPSIPPSIPESSVAFLFPFCAGGTGCVKAPGAPGAGCPPDEPGLIPPGLCIRPAVGFCK